MMACWHVVWFVICADPGIDERDPRWVGAWWLGYVISAGCVFVWCLPIVLYPPRLTGADDNATTSPDNHQDLLALLRGSEPHALPSNM